MKEVENGERYGEGEGPGVKDSWPNGCKAVNRVKNSLLWSGSMNADTLRPFSPVHKDLFGVKEERSRGGRRKKTTRGWQAEEKSAGSCVHNQNHPSLI